MNFRRGAIGTTTVALLVIAVVLAGSLAFVTMTPQLVTRTTTTTFTQTSTATTTETTTKTTAFTKTVNQSAIIAALQANLSVLSTEVSTLNSQLKLQAAIIRVLSLGCEVVVADGIGTPSPSMPWFITGIKYSGPWLAVETVYNNGSPMFSACYTGNNTLQSFSGVAQIFIQNSSLISTSTIQILATKLDGSTAVLQVGCNGQVNDTSIPYGIVTLVAPVDNAGSK